MYSAGVQEAIQNLGNTSLVTGINAYDRQIEAFLAWSGDRPFTLETVSDYWQAVSGRYSSASLNVIKYGLKRAATQALVIPGDSKSAVSIELFFKQLRPGTPGKKSRYGQTVDTDILARLRAKATRRTALKIDFLSSTGVRISEMLNARIRDCTWRDGYVFIKVMGKGKKEREVFITEELAGDITRCFASRDYLFATKSGKRMDPANVWKEIKKVGAKAGIPYLHPHIFRHSFATNTLLNKGKSLKAVSEYLGHSSTAITADLYVHDRLQPEDLFGQ